MIFFSHSSRIRIFQLIMHAVNSLITGTSRRWTPCHGPCRYFGSHFTAIKLSIKKTRTYLTRIKDIFEAIKGHLRRALCNHVVYFFVVLFQCAESGILECKLLRF